MVSAEGNENFGVCATGHTGYRLTGDIGNTKVGVGKVLILPNWGLLTRYDQVLQGLEGHGEFLEQPEDLKPAIERAFASGNPAPVNAAIQGAINPRAAAILDGYLLNDEWQSSKKRQILSRLAADFTGWESDDAKYKAEFDRVIKALITSD